MTGGAGGGGAVHGGGRVGGGWSGLGSTGGGPAWPVARLDRIARLRVLAASLPGAAVTERVIGAPFDEVWGFVSDLEESVPAFDRDVSRLRIVRTEAEPDGQRLRIHSWSPGVPLPLGFDVLLRPGWCWMVSTPRLYVVGMAAEADGDRTRYAHLEGLVAGRSRLVRAMARPALAVSRRRHRRHIERDVDGIERCVAERRQHRPT